MQEPSEDDWEGHWFNPVAFAQRWYEEEWPVRFPRESGSLTYYMKLREQKNE